MSGLIPTILLILAFLALLFALRAVGRHPRDAVTFRRNPMDGPE